MALAAVLLATLAIAVVARDLLVPHYPRIGPIALTARTYETLVPATATIVARSDRPNYINHPYIAHWNGWFWAIWSMGPDQIGEELAGQRVMIARSRDALRWSPPGVLAEPPPGRALIARGLWSEAGELRALIADSPEGIYGGKHRPLAERKDGPLRTLLMTRGPGRNWARRGWVLQGYLGNYPPIRFAGADWMMLRDERMALFAAIDRPGGDWRAPRIEPIPVPNREARNEPVAYPLDGAMHALVRSDHFPTRRLYHASRARDGRWTMVRPTGFPSEIAKFCALPLPGGGRALLGNLEPLLGRNVLHVATSRDGRSYDRIFRLRAPDAPRLDTDLVYPHAIMHRGRLYIVASHDKRGVMLLRTDLRPSRRLADRAITTLQAILLKLTLFRRSDAASGP